jgi:hypothetical protein
MAAVYAALAQDEPRNDLIFDDVLKALEAKRSPLVLTERKDHLEYLQSRFSRFVRHLVVLRVGCRPPNAWRPRRHCVCPTKKSASFWRPGAT